VEYSLKAGLDADVVVFDDDICIKAVYVMGEEKIAVDKP